MELQFEQINLLEVQENRTNAIASPKTLLDGTAKKSYSAGESSYRATLLERLGQLYRSTMQKTSRPLTRSARPACWNLPARGVTRSRSSTRTARLRTWTAPSARPMRC